MSVSHRVKKALAGHNQTVSRGYEAGTVTHWHGGAQGGGWDGYRQSPEKWTPGGTPIGARSGIIPTPT